MSDLTRAIQVATMAHGSQLDKGGEPYILHPLSVMLGMRTDAERIVAVLHDVVEDTTVTLGDLRTLGFSDEIVDAVDAISRRKEETHAEYIARCKRNELARVVKIVDIEDNLEPRRLIALGEAAAGLAKRYASALMELVREDQ